MTEIDRKQAEDLIRKTEIAYDDAWQLGDIEGIMQCISDNAVIVSPNGDVAIGKEEIRSLFTDFLGSIAMETKHTSRISRISFVTNDVAVVDGEATIEGSAELSASDRKHNFTDILVRAGDRWLISQIRAYNSVSNKQ